MKFTKIKNITNTKNTEEKEEILYHEKIINYWENQFRSILKNKEKMTLELFPIDKNWFEEYKRQVLSNNIPIYTRIDNYKNISPFDNSNILQDLQSINPSSDFILLNKNSLDSFHPSIINKKINIKLVCQFLNGKMITKIGNLLYYFYNMDENNLINEGILMFDQINENQINDVIFNFLNRNINLFINSYFEHISSSNEKFIIYHRNEFDFLIKKQQNTDSNNNSNIKLKSFQKNNIYIKQQIPTETEKSSQQLSLKSPKRNFKFKNDSNNNLISKTNNIKNISENNATFKNNNLDNIIDSIIEFYYSSEQLKNIIKDKEINKPFKMINKYWLNAFKREYLFNEIKSILSMENNSLIYKKIISDFLINHNLNNKEIDYIPVSKKELFKGTHKYYYYNDYRLITKASYKAFCKAFNIKRIAEEFKVSALNENHILVIYNDISGEIINLEDGKYKNKYLLICNSNYRIDDNFIKYLFKKEKLDLINGYKYEKILLNQKNQNIGMIMRLNKNKKHEIIKTDISLIENEKKNFEENHIPIKKNYKSKDNVYIPKIVPKIRNLNNKKTKNNNNEELFSENKLSSNNNKKQYYLNEIKEEEKNMSNYYSLISKNKTPSKQIQTHNNFFKTPNKNKNTKNSINIKLYNPYDKSNEKIKKFNEIENNSSVNIGMSESNKQTKSDHKKHNDNPFKKKKNIPHKHLKSKDIIPSKNNKFNQYYSPQPIKENKLKLEAEKTNKKNNNNEISLTDSAFDNEKNDDFINNYLKKPPGLIGLQNIGATCYMNATLQCFSNVPKFREDILSLPKKNKNEQLLCYSLRKVFYNLWRKKGRKKYYEPYSFKDLISEMNPLFAGVAANDSKDLILFILETIHKELNKKNTSDLPPNQVNNLDFMSVFKEFVNYYKSNNESIVSDEFYGYFVSVLTCANCSVKTYNVQIMNILFFPLEKVRLYTKTPNNWVSLEDCFNHYESPEIFTGASQIYCSYCKLTTNAYNENKLVVAPKTLILNLNRGKGLEFNVGIKFDEYLDIKKYVMLYTNSPCNYELIGVISHFGESNMGGHFIAYCKNSYNNQWYKYNDAMVNPSSFQEACDRGLPYVLFYRYIK